MTENIDTADSNSSARRRARWLKWAAAVVLLLGIFGADGVYWLGTRSADEANPGPVLGEDKAVTRRAEALFGKQTILLDEWGNALKRPGTQAFLVVVGSALVAGGSLYFARLLDRAHEHGDESGEPPG
jgi:hypothetical protein